tara:strand:+ start:346 stop:1566 length:1221 start_codon:yes stop_codon:yes gene_type:complete
MAEDMEVAKQFDEHLRSSRQVWLLGAGVSVNAGIPLMYPLTARVIQEVEGGEGEQKELAVKLLAYIQGELDEHCHIEHILSHLGDMIALAERARDTSFQVGEERIHKAKLQSVHHLILRHIRDVLRWGYRPAHGEQPEQVGKFGAPIVSVDDHRRFVQALYRISRAGLDAFREPVHFVTTNYDTLMEDALSLEQIVFADGFTGGGIAFWNEDVFRAAQEQTATKAVVTKLHGSIDWYRAQSEAGQIFRVRHDDLYPDRSNEGGNVVIYPQSTKYMASRLDPFGFMFQNFRGLLAPNRRQVLFICGYSFGDDHINGDMEQLILNPRSKTTVVAFSKEADGGVHPLLKRWGSSSAGDRIFVATDKGLYRGPKGPFFAAAGSARDWWTFEGVCKLLEDGLPMDVVEALE